MWREAECSTNMGRYITMTWVYDHSSYTVLRIKLQGYMNCRRTQELWCLRYNICSKMTDLCATRRATRYVATTCLPHGDWYWPRFNFTQRVTLRFLAPQIPEAIYAKYFGGSKMRGSLDLQFVHQINGTIICLTCAILCHTLPAWQKGIYEEPRDFKPDVVGGNNPRILWECACRQIEFTPFWWQRIQKAHVRSGDLTKFVKKEECS